MTLSTPLSVDTADAEARPILESVRDTYGFVPNHIAGTELDAAFAGSAWEGTPSEVA